MQTNYGKTPFYQNYIGLFEDIYSREWEFISELNVYLIETLKGLLDMGDKPSVLSSDFKLSEEPTDRLIDICKALGADTYLAGKGGTDYMDVERFEKNGLKLMIQQFEHPVYPQLFNGFQSQLSVVDLLFNCGPESMKIIRGANAGP